MHDPYRFIWREAGLRPSGFIAQLFLTVRNSVCKDNAYAFIKVVPSFRWTTYMEMYKITQNWPVSRIEVSNGRYIVNNRTGRIAALTNKGLGAGFHACQVVWYQEKLDSRLIRVLDNDLNLAFFWYSVTAARRGSG
jgi:hypothetical protein